MRQAQFPLNEFFQKGLLAVSPDTPNQVGWGVLENCRTNGTCIEGVTDVPTTQTPEAVVIKKIGLDKVQLGAATIYDENGAVLLAGIPLGSRKWSIANYNLFGIFCNGEITVVRNPDKTFSITTAYPQGNAICDNLGQAIVGGLKSWGSYTVDETMVGWSKMGSADFTLDKSNEAGYRSVGIGRVFAVHSLVGSVMVYGENGIVELYPAGTTFGMKHIKSLDIEDEKCVAAGKLVHYVRGKDKQLYRIGRNELSSGGKSAKVEVLNYKHILTEKPLDMFYVDTEDTLNIVYVGKTYKLDSFGMHSVSRRIDSVCDFVNYSSVVGSLLYASLETGWINFNKAGLLTLSEVFLSASQLTGAIGYVVTPNGRTRDIPFNYTNCIKPFLTDERFKIGFRIPYSSILTLSGMTAQTIKVDGRVGQGVKL